MGKTAFVNLFLIYAFLSFQTATSYNYNDEEIDLKLYGLTDIQVDSLQMDGFTPKILEHSKEKQKDQHYDEQFGWIDLKINEARRKRSVDSTLNQTAANLQNRTTSSEASEHTNSVSNIANNHLQTNGSVQSRWNSWSDWGECSVTCGIGREERSRSCVNQEFGGPCEGHFNETRLCQIPCVWWGNWSQWSSCSRTCGTGGIRLRHRSCKGQRLYDIISTDEEANSTDVLKRIPLQSLERMQLEVLDLSYTFCPGGQQASLQRIPCTTNATCPSRWTPWGDWTPCSKSCGIGFQQTKRKCLGINGQHQCRGNSVKFRRCYTPPCWSPWSKFTTCSSRCGVNRGYQSRIRHCRGTSQYKSEYKSCQGEAIERRQCKALPCPVWGKWGTFGRCSKSCGGGVRTRTRKCQRGICRGSTTSTTSCNEMRCPTWTQWSEFSCCTKTCGSNAYKERRRRCRYATRTKRCIGKPRDRLRCALPACNVTLPSIFESFKCGYQANPRNASGFRIFGGVISRANRWPWQGSWQHKTCSYCDWVHFCGAALIAPQWAITASHCIEESNFRVNYKNPSNSWSVVLGMHHLYKDGQRSYLKRIYIHPNYRYTEVTRADIALLKLRAPVKLSTEISPACLPKYRAPATGSNCFVTGWGYTEASYGGKVRLATQLKEAQIPLLSFSSCRNLGLVYRNYLSRRNHMCAGSPIGTAADSCTGDSGGPLICKYRDNQWSLTGITSFGFSSCGKRGHTGIYVPINNFKDWIRNTINKDESGVC